MTTVIAEQVSGRSLVSPDLFERLVDRIVTEHSKDQELASRVVDQALAFLGTCAHEHDLPLAPSELVDLGWHAFILHTRDYSDFCHRVAGRYLHHVPTGGYPVKHGERAHATLSQTAEAIRDAGFVVDPGLWPANANCSQCKNGCYDDPPPPPEGT